MEGKGQQQQREGFLAHLKLAAAAQRISELSFAPSGGRPSLWQLRLDRHAFYLKS